MNPGLLRMVIDDKSKTGVSAAILIRNIKPKRLSNGDYRIAVSSFVSAVKVDCDGYRISPKVAVSILCAMHPAHVRATNQRKRMERALADSPMLK